MSDKNTLKPVFTDDGIEKKLVYNDLPAGSDLSPPATYPFVRGIYENMYRGKPWTIRQYSGFGSVEDTNQRFKFILNQGGTGLSTAFDLPTQMGYDSDHPLAEGEVGRVRVAIDTVEDMDRLFADIPLSEVSTSMTINATATILLAFYIVVARRRGEASADLKGTTQNDILKEYIARGTYAFPPEAGLKLSVDLIEYCSLKMTKWNPISISGYHIREAGSTASEELGLTFSNALQYVEACKERGLDVNTFLPRLAFFFNCHNGFFEEIAKFRAGRRLWARLIKERYNPTVDSAMMLRFHTQTAGSSLTAQQAENNIIRTTVQALSAVLGGTQSLHTNSYDEALGLPTEKSARLALRTQQIIASETGVGDVVDPLGGSYFIENLTSEIEEKAREIISNIEERGGAMISINQAYPQKLIEESSYKYQKMVEGGAKQIVGVNCYIEDELKAPPFVVNPALETQQREKLKLFKSSRDSVALSQALKTLKEALLRGENSMEHVIRCAEVGATLGEISDEMRGVFGSLQ
jgi:methylmalonyl-CoA mutase N-terminal domain/subunit